MSGDARKEDLTNEQLQFEISEFCPKCQKYIYPEEIVQGWSKYGNSYVSKCPILKCQTEILPKLKVLYQNDHEIVQFLSPIFLKKQIESMVLINQENEIFSEQNSDKNCRIIFWNIIFYFYLINAPSFFLIESIDEDRKTQAA
jgi:hypothetical protein